MFCAKLTPGQKHLSFDYCLFFSKTSVNYLNYHYFVLCESMRNKPDNQRQATLSGLLQMKESFVLCVSAASVTNFTWALSGCDSI